jgi:hypothetical protein
MQDAGCIRYEIAMPEMEPVESSSVAAIGYDAGARALHVQFRDSGETYVYYGVAPLVFEALRSAKSKGRFVNERVVRRYIARKL